MKVKLEFESKAEKEEVLAAFKESYRVETLEEVEEKVSSRLLGPLRSAFIRGSLKKVRDVEGRDKLSSQRASLRNRAFEIFKR